MFKVTEVSKTYVLKNKKGPASSVKAVDNVSFHLKKGESYSLVGESGSGKSTLSRLLSFIEKPTAGEILFEEQPLLKLSPKQLRNKRQDFQLILQDGQSALDPRIKIYDSIAEPLRNFKSIDREEERQRIENIIQKVELSPDILGRLPHQLSGGQQKRVCIARAIILQPKAIIFDEAVSGLDVTVRKKILDLLLRLKQEMKTTYLFITHDIDVALYMSKDIYIMKEGKIVEHGQNILGLQDFKHDYSRKLISSLPRQVPDKKNKFELRGEQ